MDAHLLFRKKAALTEDGLPWLRGGSAYPHPARRNTSGKAVVSAILVRALLAALEGQIQRALRQSNGVAVEVSSKSNPGTTAWCAQVNNALCLPHGDANKVTYHFGVVFIIEALAHPHTAGDFWAAYAELLHAYQQHGKQSGLLPTLVRASDELYYFARYGAPSQGGATTQDRFLNLNVQDNAGLNFGVQADQLDLTPLQNVAACQQFAKHSPHQAVPVANFNTTLRQAVAKAIANLSTEVEAILAAGQVPFLLGPTGAGKTSAVRQVATGNGWGFEEVAGSAAFADADLVGLRMPGGVNVPGVLARAFGRARMLDETVLVFFDELTRFNARALDILMRPLLPTPQAIAHALGYTEATGDVRVVEAPLWGVEWAAAERIYIALAANPWGSPLDPALMRRVVPVQADFADNVAACFANPLADAVQASWKAAREGTLPLPLEYQALTQAQHAKDVSILRPYLARLYALDSTAASGFTTILEGMGIKL
jgi:hypothetical protein